MMDASILLPPTGTPLTGIDFVKRLPCGDVEKTRRVSVILPLLAIEKGSLGQLKPASNICLVTYIDCHLTHTYDHTWLSMYYHTWLFQSLLPLEIGTWDSLATGTSVGSCQTTCTRAECSQNPEWKPGQVSFKHGGAEARTPSIEEMGMNLDSGQYTSKVSGNER